MSRENRLIYLDYLKVLGLLLVILAHVSCPNVIMQIRSFDVPLLVFVSAYLASKTYIPGQNVQYFVKRIKRLAVPAWIFLIVFFIIQTVAYSKPSIIDIIKAITFQRDSNMVGMLWVIWVYLICALLIPVIQKMDLSRKSEAIIIVGFIMFELICTFTNLSNNRFVYITIMTIIPWGALSYFGFYYDQISAKKKMQIVIFSSLIFIILAIILANRYGHFIMTNDYKYPARLYYVSFSVPIIVFLMEYSKKMYLPEIRILSFVSSSSLWIYLWHILFLYVVKSIIQNDNYWLLQYVLIVILSVIITYIQNFIVKKMMLKYEWNFLKVFLG